MLGVGTVAINFHPQLVAAKPKPGQLFDLLVPLLIQPQVSRHSVWLSGLKPSKVGERLPAYSLWQLGAADQTLCPPPSLLTSPLPRQACRKQPA